MSMKGKGFRRVDMFPNYLHFVISESVIGDTKQVTIQLPQYKLRTSTAKATIIEILWVDFNADYDQTDPGGVAEIICELYTGPQALNILLPRNQRVFAWTNTQSEVVGPGGGFFKDKVVRFMLQTTDGFGFLVGGDTINCALEYTSVSAQTVDVDVVIAYRFVEVGIAEYVGIVQSEQQSIVT